MRKGEITKIGFFSLADWVFRENAKAQRKQIKGPNRKERIGMIINPDLTRYPKIDSLK